ncbi:MAG TPA: hypothetical protein VD963_04730 [Phycisphaerales bacterium]|nr:hypothetical protein [Phycisphaerales bacterium]
MPVTAPTRRTATVLGAAALALCTLCASGCMLGALVGGMEESRRRSSTRAVAASYDGLAGKSFAVVVAADRIIQADHPDVVPLLTYRISEQLRNHAGAAGFVPPDRVMGFLSANPRWVAMAPEELADRLGVERLVHVELQEFRLNDPGNQYLWAGVAAGTISVVEADGPAPEVFGFQEAISVDFPDQTGYGPAEMSAQVVKTALARRFIDRASWLFYEHQEPYYPEY